MKTHQLIILTTALFIVLFYDEDRLGLNFAILGIFFSVFTLINTVKKNRSKTFWILFATSILSSISFGWYGDFPSFVMIILSLLLLNLKGKAKRIHLLLFIPAYITSGFTFICRFFDFEKWIPLRKKSNGWQQFFAILLIPLFFVTVFFVIYTYGSDHFANLFEGYEWNLDFLAFFGLMILGFIIAFNYWNVAVERLIYKKNRDLSNDFTPENQKLKPTFSFLNIEFERISGIVTFMCLNALLLVFIITFNYEQFFVEETKSTMLSAETHERVNAVILSIVMAIVVLMFYFKSGFNFDTEAKWLKISAYIWLILNAILVLSAFIKNTEYISTFDLTYKRLGVYAFLILCWLGLYFSIIKIKRQKTNAFLFNTAFWSVYGIVFLTAIVNWGSIITQYNLTKSNFDLTYLTDDVDYNEQELLNYLRAKNLKKEQDYIEGKIENNKQNSFLSKVLFYDFVGN